MGLASDEHSDPLGDGSLQLLIQLVDTDSVTEVEDTVVIWLASENYRDIQGNKDIVVSWASSNWEFVGDVLLGHKELDLGPGEANNKATLFLNGVKLAMLCNDCIGSFWNINIWSTTASLWNQNDWSFSSLGIVSEPLKRIIDIGHSDSCEVRSLSVLILATFSVFSVK